MSTNNENQHTFHSCWHFPDPNAPAILLTTWPAIWTVIKVITCADAARAAPPRLSRRERQRCARALSPPPRTAMHHPPRETASPARRCATRATVPGGTRAPRSRQGPRGQNVQGGPGEGFHAQNKLVHAWCSSTPLCPLFISPHLQPPPSFRRTFRCAHCLCFRGPLFVLICRSVERMVACCVVLKEDQNSIRFPEVLLGRALGCWNEGRAVIPCSKLYLHASAVLPIVGTRLLPAPF